MKKILLAVDGSQNSVRAARYAAELASKFGARITLFLVIPPSDSALFSGKDTYIPEDKSIYDERLDDAIKALRDKGIEFEKRLEFGHPADEILKASNEGFDTIVVGSRGLSGIRSFLLGSVSSNVVHHAKIPVIVVP